MTKLSELIADPNTVLSSVAPGDHLIVSDTSEPLDIRKIKVIPISDFQDSIMTPVVTARQGGSGTDWNSPGTTNYTPTKSIIQCGMVTIDTVNGQAYASAVITFPVAFSYKPLIFLSFGDITYITSSGNLYEGPYVNASGITASGFTIYIHFPELQSPGGNDNQVFWQAIGPIA